MKMYNVVTIIIVGGALIFASIDGFADSREQYLQEKQAKQKRIEEVQMMDLGIDSPPKVDRNTIGPWDHHTERSAEKQFIIYTYPKYFFANDGTLQPTKIQLRRSEKEGIAYEMEDAVYHFYASPDGSYWIFHYGMWMYFYINDIAYLDRSTGMFHSLGWKRVASEPSVQPRLLEWSEIYPGVGVKIELSEDFVEESILLTESARAALPDPKNFGLQPENTDIVLVYDFVMDELCDDYLFPDFDLREEYIVADYNGNYAKSDNFAINGEVTFSRNGIVRHEFLRDEALLPGYIDRDQTPELRTEVQKYWQNTSDGKTLLAYGIPYSIHQTAKEGTIVIDPTVKFQEGIYSYSGSYMSQIRGDSGYMNYNYGRDTMLKVADNSSGTKWRSLLKFNLSSLSTIASASVTSAYVRMKFSSYAGTMATRTAYAYQIKRDWNEGNSAQGETPQNGEVTWNQAKYNQTSWSTAGCDNTTYDRNATEDSLITLATTVGNWNQWTITNSVKSWFSNSLANNYGVLIKPSWTSGYPEFVHCSDDDATAANRPQLVINVSCFYSRPECDIVYEILGSNTPEPDGIVFKRNGTSTINWYSGEEMTMDWTLTTFKSYRDYGPGQFLRMWIDLNCNCLFEAAEEVILRAENGTERPYVYASNGSHIGDFCEVTVGYQTGSFIAPLSDVSADHHFTYKFTVPSLSGTSYTTARVLLRYYGWPNDDPMKTFDDVVTTLGDGCGSPFGDCEDYTININP